MNKTTRFSVHAPVDVQYKMPEIQQIEQIHHVITQLINPNDIIVNKACVNCREKNEMQVECINCGRGICENCLDSTEIDLLLIYKQHTPCGCGFNKQCNYCNDNESKMNLTNETNTTEQENAHWGNVFARLCVNRCGEYIEDNMKCLECKGGMCYHCFADEEFDSFKKYIEHNNCWCGFEKYCYNCEKNN
jgi:hypothetical protein